MAVLFDWDETEMNALLASCERDDVTVLVRRFLAPGSTVLEAGCGAGRYVRFLADRGYAVSGVELNDDAVSMVRRLWPDLDVIMGDVLELPYPNEHFDGILSLGVVEHFTAGPGDALLEICRVLRPGGVAIVTVPQRRPPREARVLASRDQLCPRHPTGRR
jgi:SAM-dependent methyltransferase